MKKWTNTNPMRRLLSLALSVVMVLSVLPMPSIAAEGDGLCEHHPEHTGCGYVAAVEGHDCGHVCGEECYTVTTDCQHVHDESCYSDGVLPAEGEEKAADACAHTACTEESGCVTKAHTCTHKHDGSCGYVEAVAGSPCTYQCDLCTGASEPELLLEDTVLTDWEWVDPDEWLDETGSFAMPGVTEDYPAYFEDVVEYLPTQITALIDGGEVTLDLGDWSCDDYPVETGTSQGEFVFTATLPEGYVLADGSNTLRLPVTVAPMDLSDWEDVSGYNSGGNGTNESWDSVDSNGVRNWNKDTSAFQTGVGNSMHYRKITKQYTGDVEWTEYEYLWKTNDNPGGVTVYPGYCVHSQTAEITGTLTIKDDIHLILCAEQTNADELPDMVLTVGSINIESGKTLTIWTKNGGWQGGKLIVKGDISGGGTLVVRDGYVEAQNITCQFSTGGSANGKQSLGVVKANSISDQSGKANWGGVIVENGVGRACGTSEQELIYDLQCKELTIDSEKTLTVGWDGYQNSEGTNIGARHNVELIANNLVNNGTLINKAKLYYNTQSGSGETAASNGRYGYYKNENGQKVYRPFTLVTSDITELTNTADTNDGWYLVSGNVEWAKRVAVAARNKVNLVLADGCTLTANEGITVGGAGGPTLIIWCQEAGTGTLKAQTSNEQCAAIGMNGNDTSTGVITIHGGNINAEYTGAGSINSEDCGLGGHYTSAACTVTINGGTINTPALVSNNLTINGGTITVLNRISGRFSAPATDGGSTFVTADSNWAGGTSNRRGLFFVGDTGEVCTGSDTELTLARAMEVPADKTLVIPQGKTLKAGSHLTNSGAVCVGGAYTGSLSGDIYYRLSVEGGTAASATETKTIGGVTYVKADSTVTLTPGAAPDGKRFDHWNPPAGLTLTGNTFPMPAKTVDISAEYIDAVVITQSPEDKEITYGGIATLNVSAENPSGDTEGITYQWYQVSGGQNVELSNETSGSLTLTKPNAGTYVYFCRVTWDGISIDSSSATVTVNKAKASVNITGNPGKTYDGQPAVLTNTMYTTTGDGTVTVQYAKQGETNYSTNAPKDAGSYTVRVTLHAGTNFTEASDTENFTISKATDNKWQTEPSVTNFTYGDTVTNPVKYQALYGDDDVVVTYKKQGTADTPSATVPTDAGTYDVTVSLAETNNYSPKLEATNLTLTIEKAASSVTTAPTDAQSLYSGSPVLLVNAGTVQGGTMHYSLDGQNWSNDIPKATDWKTYTVHYKVAGDNNHNDTEAESLTAEIVPFKIVEQTEAVATSYGDSPLMYVDLKTQLSEQISYQWYQVTGSEGDVELSGETANKLTIDKPNAGTYSYICKITCGEYSATSAEAVVTVNAVSQPLPTTDLPGGMWAEGGEKPLVGNSIDLKSPSSSFLTSYSEVAGTDESKGYPTGMDVYVLKDDGGTLKPERVEIFTDLLKYEGCSIRVTGKPGIRMITSIDENLKKELIQDGYEDYTLEAYGTVAQWSTTLGDQPLTLSTGNPGVAYDASSGTDPIFGRSNGRVQYTNVLVWNELAADKYNEDIVMRPFIKLRKGTQELVIYGGTVSRSIGYVAQQNANTFPVGSAGYNYVHNIIDKVANLNQSNESTTTAGGNGE